jgi:hypothetical protein
MRIRFPSRSALLEFGMKTTTERAAEALDRLPEEMREPAVAYLLEQAERYRALKDMVAEGMDDVTAGRVSQWNFADFLREARLRPRDPE